MPLVTGPYKTYQCPGCHPEDPMREVIVLHGVYLSRPEFESWDGRVALHCFRHGSFEVQFIEQGIEDGAA